jgi:hypothetical protein
MHCAPLANFLTTQLPRWRGIFAGDAVTDFAIAIFAADVIWRTQASFRVRLTWYFPFLIRIWYDHNCRSSSAAVNTIQSLMSSSIPVCSGLRLITVGASDFESDPTLDIWLFVIVSQIQIFLSLIGYTSPALKKTMLDLATNFGNTNESHASSARHNGSSLAPKSLGYRKSSIAGSWKTSGIHLGTLRSAASHTKSQTVVEGGRPESDSGSQEGIIRRDEVEVSYARATPHVNAEEHWR